jgi:mutator protein MutT
MMTLHTTLVFLLRGDELLLAMKKRGFGAGKWNGIGGKVDAGETLEQAMVRECQEEIGTTPLSYDKVALHTFYAPYKGEPSQIFTHTYLCSEWQGTPVETEEMAPQWYKVTDIPYGQMWADDVLWLPKVLEGIKLETVFHLDEQDKLLSQDIREVARLA